MATIDPNIALQASQTPNLIQTLAGATQLRGQIQQQQANMAASQAYKAATNPQTGEIDYNALTAALSQGPAAYNLPQIQAQINEARNSQLTYDKNKLELAGKRLDYLSGGFGGLLASGNITPGSIMAIATQGIKQGLFTPEDAVNFTRDMPQDPSGLANWARQKYVGFSQDTDRLKTLLPQTQTVNNGAGTTILAIDPLTGQPKGSSTFIPSAPSPEFQQSLKQVYNPQTGALEYQTQQQVAAQAGVGQPYGTAQDQAPSGLGTGRLSGQAPVGAAQAAPAIGAQTAAETVAKGAADASLALQSQADAAPQAIYQLQNMRAALQNFTPGPTSDWAGQAKALALQVSPELAKKWGLVDPQSVASQEEFKKFATQFAQGLSGSLGPGSDAKLVSAVAASPNASYSKLGNEQIIDVIQATQRGLIAKNIAWQNAQANGAQPQDFNKFSTDFNRQIDPRVFAAQDMSKDQIDKMMGSLSPQDQKTFKKSFNMAVYNGLIQ